MGRRGRTGVPGLRVALVALALLPALGACGGTAAAGDPGVADAPGDGVLPDADAPRQDDGPRDGTDADDPPTDAGDPGDAPPADAPQDPAPPVDTPAEAGDPGTPGDPGADAPDPDDAPPGDAPQDPAQPIDTTTETGDPGPPDDVPADAPGPACTADGDGVLRAGEVAVFRGAAVRYTVRAGDAAPVPDLQGTPCAAGLCWDFSAPVDGDAVEVDVVKPVSDWWFGEGFPADAFVVDLEPGMLAVYRLDSQALWMLGLASESEGPDRVRLAYDPPVPILKFPLAKGDAWEVQVEASGRYDGYDYPMVTMMGTVRVLHTYRFTANGLGDVTVPLGTFRALRLLLDLRMDVVNSLNPTPLATQRYKVYDFLSECLGLVARVRSAEGEVRTFFPEATEYRRLGF